MEQKTLLFTDQKIKEMIIPLFLEQLLLFSVGFSVVIMLFVLVWNRWMLPILIRLWRYTMPVQLCIEALERQMWPLVIWLVLIHNVFNATAYPFSGALSNGLRSAGDVKFTMYVSIISTIVVRLFLSWLLGIVFDMGVIGIALAMVSDWIVRAVIFLWRQKSGKWKNFQVIWGRKRIICVEDMRHILP